MATTNVGWPLRQGGAATRPYPDFGGETSAIYCYDIVPATLAANNIAASQSVASATTVVLTAGSGVTATTVNGTVRYRLDVPRAVRIVSAGNDTGITFTVAGYDVYGAPMTETITGANASTANGNKAWYDIVSITTSGASASTLTIGTTDKLGLPYQVLDAGRIISVKWNNTLAADAGTFVASVTTTPSATTGDVRGTYTPSSASDGSKRLVIAMLLPNPDKANAATTETSLYGRVQA